MLQLLLINTSYYGIALTNYNLNNHPPHTLLLSRKEFKLKILFLIINKQFFTYNTYSLRNNE